MTLGAWVAGASHDASITVQAKFETLVVNLVDDGLHTLWPLGRIGYKVAGAVPLLAVPAVVNVEVLVASVLEAQGNHEIGDFESRVGTGMCTATIVLPGGQQARRNAMSSATNPVVVSERRSSAQSVLQSLVQHFILTGWSCKRNALNDRSHEKRRCNVLHVFCIE
jgi:hypothetical protein